MPELNGIIGKSSIMRQINDIVHSVADTDSTVLISGASGTGKELVAQNIHRLSGRKAFVAINCAAISADLIESILFGHERGSFTGAYNQQIGKFEQANGGTLFLDEIGSMRLDLQAKLLRVLQEREIERIGGRRTIPVDVRVIAAANEDMLGLVSRGAFREDLYYRISVIPIHLPTLAERRSDIPLLVNHFVQHFNTRFGRNVEGFTDAAMSILKDYDWPGNVRQLENIVERMVVIRREGMIDEGHLPRELLGEMDCCLENSTLKDATEEFTKRYIIKCLRECYWNKTQAAKRLGIHRNTLMNIIKALSISGIHETEAAA